MLSFGASYLEKYRTNVLPGRVMLLHMQFAVALLTYSFETKLAQKFISNEDGAAVYCKLEALFKSKP